MRATLLGALMVLPASPLLAQADNKDEKKDAPAAAADSKKVIPDVDLADPEGLGKNADEAFAKGQWLQAAANYNGLVTIGLKVGVKKEEMEPLYFIIGVCMFNLPNYDEALKRFTEYTQLYPTGPKIHQVNLAIARIFRAQKKWPEAIKQYKPLVDIPVTRDDALIEISDCYKENQEKDKAIVLLETKLAPGLKNTEDVRAALYLVDLYEEKPEKGVAMLEKVKMTPAARSVVAEINYAAMKVAESLMGAGEGKFEEALQAFQNIRKKKEVVDTLKALDADYGRAITGLEARTGRNVPGAAANMQRLDRMKFFQKQAQTLATNLEKEANYDAVLYYRIGRCFAALERFWEARLAFRYVYDEFPKFEDRPNVLYALAYCNYQLTPQDLAEDRLKMAAETDKLLVEFLTKYKDREETTQVADMRVNLANRTKDPDKVNKIFEEVSELIKGSPNYSGYQAQMVNNYLSQFKFPEAQKLADEFLNSAAADDPQREVVEYMRALIPFFTNKYDDALKALNDFLGKYPAGGYTADATYRLAFLMKGIEMTKKKEWLKQTDYGKAKGPPRFRNVLEKCDVIIATYPGTDTVANAHALKGDCYKEMVGEEIKEAGLEGGKWETSAADAYVQAVLSSKNDQVAEYSLNMAKPLLTKHSRWAEVRQIYEHFLNNYKDHRIALQAVGEICKAIERLPENLKEEELSAAEKAKDQPTVDKILAERQTAKDEARKQSREYLAKTILENINNPQKEGVEELMQQLASAAIPKKRTRPAGPAPVSVAPGTTTPGTAAPVRPKMEPIPPAELGKEAEAELDRLLSSSEGLGSVAKARIIYVKALLYKDLESRVRPRKDEKGNYIEDKTSKRSEELEKQLINDYKPDDYSSAMLAMIGDKYYKDGDKEYAKRCFNRLNSGFPNSLFLDWAAVGLGDIAVAAATDSKGTVDPQNPLLQDALKQYTRAIDEFPGAKYGEAIMGRAKVQFYLDKLEEAEGPLKEISADKNYPLETKAEATWLLGEIKHKQKDYAGAYNYFQRLYVSFKKSPFWACRGYLRAGMTKQDLGKHSDAKEVYREAVEIPANADRFKGLSDFEIIKVKFSQL